MVYKAVLFAALILSCFIRDTRDSPEVVSNTQNPEILPCHEKDVVHYTAHQTTTPLTIDGSLDEPAWKAATRSPRFVDLVKGTPTHLDTKAAVLWDEKYLYVAYLIEEPHVKATLTERDAPIYRDNDVELFIAGPDGYYEFEINAHGTIYEVLFFWEDTFEKNGYSHLPEFDRTREGVKPFNGVGYKSHPRGKRVGFWNWDYPGLMKAVHVDGTINNDKDRDRGWTVELALPWAGFAKWNGGRSLPPHNGDVWRMDFSRFNTYKEPAPAHDSGGWVMSPHGVWDSHVPECFSAVEFSKEPVEKATK
jgi:hypothetical protein